jgi:hypothetical protein
MKNTRRKFLFAGLSLAALTAALRFTKKPTEKTTVKFLTQEGRLVEIETDKIPSSKKAASKKDLQYWVKKNK